jgi:hypothetical protein
MITAAAAAALAAGVGVLGFVGERAALAQQPGQWQCQPPRPTTLEGAEGGILTGSFGAQTLAIGGCAPGIIRVDQGSTYTDPPYSSPSYEPGHDPGDGFDYIFDVRPCDLAGGSDLPGAKLTVTYIPPPSMPLFRMQTVLTLAPDKDKPTLKTTSTPRKGTKVKPGDTIKVRMEASEEYNNPRYGWQTGVKKIQLIDEGPNPVVTPRWEGAQMRPCKEKQWKQFLEVTYTVPPNPPPIVRLRAVAEDFAGNKDDDLGEFPTGDWYGTIGWTHICTGGGNTDETRGTGDLALDYDDRGNLTGRLAGSIPERKQTIPPCSFKYVAPATFSAKLVGSYTPGPDTFSAQAVEGRTTPGRASWICPAGGGDVQDQGFYGVYETPMFRDAFRDLRRQPEGGLKSNGEKTITSGEGSCTTTYSLTLKPAQN